MWNNIADDRGIVISRRRDFLLKN